MVPMVATRMVNLEQVFPYIVGCGLATTVDLSQLYGYVAGGVVGVMLGSVHIILNVFSVLVWLILPLRAIPLKMARTIGQRIATSKHSILLLIGYALSFVIIPLIILIITQSI